jgi:hypothetical protein
MSGSLDHSPEDVLRCLLIELDCGILPTSKSPLVNGDWPIYVSSLPNLPDQVITIKGTTGRFDGRSMRSGQKFEFHGVQIMVRGINQNDAQIKANEIKQVIDTEIRNETVVIPLDVGTGTGLDDSTYKVQNVSRSSGPIPLGKEQDSNRFLFTINAVISLRQVS